MTRTMKGLKSTPDPAMIASIRILAILMEDKGALIIPMLTLLADKPNTSLLIMMREDRELKGGLINRILGHHRNMPTGTKNLVPPTLQAIHEERIIAPHSTRPPIKPQATHNMIPKILMTPTKMNTTTNNKNPTGKNRPPTMKMTITGSNRHSKMMPQTPPMTMIRPTGTAKRGGIKINTMTPPHTRWLIKTKKFYLHRW